MGFEWVQRQVKFTDRAKVLQKLEKKYLNLYIYIYNLYIILEYWRKLIEILVVVIKSQILWIKWIQSCY